MSYEYYQAPSNQQELDVAVEKFRHSCLRNFDYRIEKKITDIADYLKKANINNVVVGVSGGIDSAVVIALLVKVKEILPSLKIHAYTIHFSIYDGIFDTKYVQMMEERFGSDVIFKTLDATNGFNALMSDMNLSDEDSQLKAQSSYALRYQMLFTYSQLHKAVTIGTTNEDEFSYAGWFGKNSDMVVDLQVITDWHKFLVVEAAKILGVPDAIIERKPVGDLLDRSTDEENFGCSYDELAYFAYYSKNGWITERNNNQFLVDKFAKLRALHEKNAHKYQGQTFNPVFI
jgi:NAD+ synthetase